MTPCRAAQVERCAGWNTSGSLPHLRNLVSSWRPDNGCRLANVEGLSELECVGLGDTGITDAGLGRSRRCADYEPFASATRESPAAAWSISRDWPELGEPGPAELPLGNNLNG